MAILTAVVPTFSGALLGATAAAAGDKFVNDGNQLLYIKNASAGTVTLTLTAQTVGGLTITNPTVSVAAAAEKVVGPFNPLYFTDSTGFLNLSYSATASVTVAVIQKQ